MKSMTFGTMPTFESFSKHLDSYKDMDGEHASWGGRYPMELAGRGDQSAAAWVFTSAAFRPYLRDYTTFEGRYGKMGIHLHSKKALWVFIKTLASKGSESADSLASAMMSTLGYEWI